MADKFRDREKGEELRYEIEQELQFKAESRRNSRFEALGHTSGPVDTSTWPADTQVRHGGGEYPSTLDLRRFLPGHRD